MNDSCPNRKPGGAWCILKKGHEGLCDDGLRKLHQGVCTCPVCLPEKPRFAPGLDVKWEPADLIRRLREDKNG